ncbi:hypothetical protein B484DRAFT_181937 [Ochromonadaceae sp. CCMP2298]|nr:hypothetical protein B484DRAFT_181937 [Ochromonadaceae sp. CCMP2298]
MQVKSQKYHNSMVNLAEGDIPTKEYMAQSKRTSRELEEGIRRLSALSSVGAVASERKLNKLRLRAKNHQKAVQERVLREDRAKERVGVIAEYIGERCTCHTPLLPAFFDAFIIPHPCVCSTTPNTTNTPPHTPLQRQAGRQSKSETRSPLMTGCSSVYARPYTPSARSRAWSTRVRSSRRVRADVRSFCALGYI